MSARPAAACLAAVLVLGVGLAAWALRPPPPRPIEAPAAAFSAARALPDIVAIAQRPHPSGSADNARVRAYLVGRLQGLGLEAAVRPGPAPNIAALLPGTDPAEPAVVLMSHYDSVAAGPGAADDGAGVAATLEIVRALKAAGPRRRDVMVLITDGEEQGLRGSRAFFAVDPLRRRVGVVLNMEARGAGGRAVMFETHREAGAMIALLRRAGALHGASSLMPDLYRRLPNDTDLSNALAAGHDGLNFAFFADQAAYHTADDTPGRLDLGSVQHMGDQVLAAALVLADAPRLPARAPDRVYADILGGPVVSYGAPVGWVLIAAAALGLAWASRRTRPRAIAVGAGVFLSIVLATALSLTGAAVLAAAGPAGFHGLLRQYSLALTGYATLTIGVALALIAAASRRGVTSEGLWLGALWVGALGAAGLQLAAPLDAFMATWPLLAGVTAATLPANRAGRVAATAVCALAFAQIAYWAGLMFALVGVALPMILAAFAALSLLVLAPWAARAMEDRGRWAWGAGLAVFGLITLMIAAWR